MVDGTSETFCSLSFCVDVIPFSNRGCVFSVGPLGPFFVCVDHNPICVKANCSMFFSERMLVAYHEPWMDQWDATKAGFPLAPHLLSTPRLDFLGWANA